MSQKKWINDDHIIQEKIQSFVSEFGFDQTDVLENMISTLVKMFKDNRFDSADLKIVDQTLIEFRNSFRTFYPYRDSRKICIFGSARTATDHPEYIMAEQFAHHITRKGFMIITGAGGGIMEAGNKGADVNKSFGVNINLPFEQEPNAYIRGDSKCISYNYFFNRKLTFIKESDGVVLCPGGFGTHDECFEVLTLIQTGRCSPRPIVLLSQPGNTYWTDWISFIQHQLVEKEYVSGRDISLFHLSHSANDAAGYISQFYSRYHSIRYIDNLAVIRMKKALPETALSAIPTDFPNLCTDGICEQFAPGKYFKDDHFPDKYRLVFSFNKKDYSDLIELIHFINQA